MKMTMLLATCLLLAAASMVRSQLVTLPTDLSFSCSDRLSGFYADPLYDCQVFHICVDGTRHGSMLCPVGTAFSQSLFTCTWAVDADCVNAQDNYLLNGRLYYQDEDPAVRDALGGRNAFEQVSSADHPGKSLDHVQPFVQDRTESFSRQEGRIAQDGARQLFEQPPKFVNNFDDTGNDIDDIPISIEEPIYVPSIVFTLPVGEERNSDEDELFRVAENVQHIREILLPKEGRSLISSVSSRPKDEYLPRVTDNSAQDSILSINNILPPVQNDIPSTNDYLPPVQDDTPTTNDYLPPVQDDTPPTNDYLPPVQDDTPPTEDYLPPVEDVIIPTNDYLPPVQDKLPSTSDFHPVQDEVTPTNDYFLPVQDSITETNDYLPSVQDPTTITNLAPDVDYFIETNDYLPPVLDAILPTNDHLPPNE